MNFKSDVLNLLIFDEHFMVGHSLYWLKGQSHSYQKKVHIKKENKVTNMLKTGKPYNKEYKIRT